MDRETSMQMLRNRLRRSPTDHTVAGSLPVLFFGDLFTATIATAGINPSYREYVDSSGRELDGVFRRFETLSSLGAESRASLTDDQCDRAIKSMDHYFGPGGRPVYEWFRHLHDLLRGIGYSYESGDVAHLNLVQEATKPTWSDLERTEAKQLLDTGERFLQQEVVSFPLQVLLCNGRTPFDAMRRLIDGEVVASGEFQRLTWHVVDGKIASRRIGIAGWNIPLQRRTGLDSSGPASEETFGQLLRQELSGHGLL